MTVQLPAVKIETEYIPLNGGLDVVTPSLSRKPGTCRLAQNFEQSINGGYRRIAGYERYDGHARPSDATYTIIQANITGAIAVGDVITGNTSAATGTVIALPAGSIVITKVTGTFLPFEFLKVGGTTRAESIGDPIIGGASTQALDATYTNLAADVYRALISAVPGSGPVRGVIEFGGIKYAFRDNAGGTAGALYKSSGSGWTAVGLGRELAFNSGGTYVVKEGDTITGAVSGATAVITRVVITSGSLSAGTAAGKYIFASQTGTFQAENLNVVANLNVSTIAGNSSAIVLAPGGRCEFEVTNFGGAINTNRIYGCDGANRGFEFDGTVYVPIDTGMSPDTPTHVKEHLKQLFYSFVGSVQHAAPGTPYIWSVILGAAELAMGDTVTGFSTQPGTNTTAAMAIFTRNRTSILYGTGVSTWQLIPYRKELGAYANTIQDMGKTVFLDDRGITDFQTVQEFGNFAHNALTNAIKPLMDEYRVSAVASCVSRDLNEYRLFFTSGYAIYLTMLGNKVIGAMLESFPDVVRCIWSGEQGDGSEIILFGTDSGYVMQMERGTSFDGAAIDYYINLAYNNSRSPRIIKHYRHAMVEISGGSYCEYDFGYDLGSSTTQIDQPADQALATELSVVFWDSFTWDSFYWDGQSTVPNEVDMEGDAENCSIVIRGSSDEYAAFTVTGIITHFTPRRQMR